MLKFVINRHSIPIYILIIIQQLIVASSTYLLTGAAAEVVKGHLPLTLLIAYLLSLFLPFLPAIAASVILAKWEINFHREFLNHYCQTFNGRIDLWRQKKIKLKTIGLVSQELPHTAKSWTDYHFNIFSTALNVFLNIMTIAIVVDPSFVWAFAVTLGLSTLTIKICSKHLEKLSQNSQNDRITLSGIKSNSWDFVTLGNTYSINHFKSELDSSFLKMSQSTLSLAKYAGFFSIMMASIAFIPSLVNVLFVVKKIHTNTAALAALLVALPRLFLVLNYTYDLLQQIFDWNNQATRIKGLELGLSPSKGEIEGEIDLNKIKINGIPLSLEDLENLKSGCYQTGRLTIEGENGSGKSTLLLKIKEALGTRAHYLPPFGEAEFKDLDQGRSTGQQLRHRMHQLLQDLPSDTVLLLDEWSANLDTSNKTQINAWLDECAKKSCIVEIVHRTA